MIDEVAAWRRGATPPLRFGVSAFVIARPTAEEAAHHRFQAAGIELFMLHVQPFEAEMKRFAEGAFHACGSDGVIPILRRPIPAATLGDLACEAPRHIRKSQVIGELTSC